MSVGLPVTAVACNSRSPRQCASLSAAGHTWRREQAASLRAERVSINRIAALFGVTRQRISALLKE
jgi:hypothetical protein